MSAFAEVRPQTGQIPVGASGGTSGVGPLAMIISDIFRVEVYLILLESCEHVESNAICDYSGARVRYWQTIRQLERRILWLKTT